MSVGSGECVLMTAHRAGRSRRSDLASGYDPRVAETTQSLDERLEEIGTQLAWVRDYL